MSLIKTMCLDLIKVLGSILTVGLIFIVLPVAIVYWYLKLPYEWSHGTMFMTLKWGLVVTVVGLGGLLWVAIFMEWIDDAKRRSRK